MATTTFKLEGCQQLIPYFIVNGADEFIGFIKSAFGAAEVSRDTDEKGTVRYALLPIGDTALELSEEKPEHPGAAMTLHLYVEDIDAVYAAAIRAGAASLSEPRQMFYGERSGGVKDRWGNRWWIATHNEDVSWEEMQRRMQANGH